MLIAPDAQCTQENSGTFMTATMYITKFPWRAWNRRCYGQHCSVLEVRRCASLKNYSRGARLWHFSADKKHGRGQTIREQLIKLIGRHACCCETSSSKGWKRRPSSATKQIAQLVLRELALNCEPWGSLSAESLKRVRNDR